MGSPLNNNVPEGRSVPAWTVFLPQAWTKTDIFDPTPLSCPRSYVLNGP